MATVPTPDDVFTGLLTKLKADAGFNTQLPGDAWFGRRAADKGFPYMVLTVEEQEPDYVESSGSYLQTYVVELSVWCKSGDKTAAQTGPARQWLDGLLNGTPTNPSAGVEVPNAIKTVSVLPAGGSLKLTPELRRGQDVLATGKRLAVMVQGQNVTPTQGNP